MADDPTSVVGRRVVAAAIDVALVGLVAFADLLVAAERTANHGVPGGSCSQAVQWCVALGDTTLVAAGGRLAAVLGVAGLYGVGALIVRRGRTGRSPGMDALRLRVVDAAGRPPGVGPAAVRSMAGIADYLPCCLPIVGVVTMASSPFHQRVGDLAAHTYVVPAPRVGHAVTGGADVATPLGAADASWSGDAGVGNLGDSRGAGQPDADATMATGRGVVGAWAPGAGVSPGTAATRGGATVRWVATGAGALVAAVLLVVAWTAPVRVEGRACGSVLSPSGACGPVETAIVVVVSVGLASIPLLVVAGPFWLLALRRSSGSPRNGSSSGSPPEPPGGP